MACPRSGSPASVVAEVGDYFRIRPYTPHGVYRPQNLDELVIAMKEIGDRGGRAKAVGSLMSLSAAHQSDDYVICTDRLNRYLSVPHPAPPLEGPPPAAFREGGQAPWLSRLVGDAWRRDADPRMARDPGLRPAESSFSVTEPGVFGAQAPSPLDPITRTDPAGARFGSRFEGRFLVHVEAGIQFRHLIHNLDQWGLGLPTMGAGGRQSLAGALATGTHGSDFTLPPPAGMVKAVHLVGPDGREWWVEGDEGLLRGGSHSELPGWCATNAHIVRDSAFLGAAVVSVGRVGVVYSMVLEVEAQYWLVETIEKARWTDFRSRLTDATAFDEPLDGEPLRFLSVVLDTANFKCCWITRRWKTFSRDAIVPPSDEDFIGAFCQSPVGLLRSKLFRDLERELDLPFTIEEAGRRAGLIRAGLDLLLFSTGGRYRDLRNMIRLAELIVRAADSAATSGEFLDEIIRILRRQERFDMLASISERVTDGQHRWTGGGADCAGGSASRRRGPSHQILDTAVYSRSDPFDGKGAVCGWSGACYRVRSAEYFFDARNTSYLVFIDEMAELARLIRGTVGGVALRFTRGWPRSLSMQRYPLTVAVEVATARDIDAHRIFMATVDVLARRHGGIPHWGQEHRLSERDVEQGYGPALEEFKWAVAEIERSRPDGFSSEFTRSRGLDPDRALEAYQAERYGAALLYGQ